MVKNRVSHLLLDLLGDKLFWNAIFRSGVDLLALPLVMAAAVTGELVRDLTAARRGRGSGKSLTGGCPSKNGLLRIPTRDEGTA